MKRRLLDESGVTDRSPLLIYANKLRCSINLCLAFTQNTGFISVHHPVEASFFG
jgi:hypothetical protein